MVPAVTSLASHLASVLLTLAVLVVLAGLVALIAARTLGGRSRLRRQVIFAAIGFVGLIVAVLVAPTQLRAQPVYRCTVGGKVTYTDTPCKLPGSVSAGAATVPCSGLTI